jgi:hypothetical protein
LLQLIRAIFILRVVKKFLPLCLLTVLRMVNAPHDPRLSVHGFTGPSDATTA